MSYIVVDVEADGPCPGLYSMISLGAVVVEPSLSKTFYGTCHPISYDYKEEALKVSGNTRLSTLGFDDPALTMIRFKQWLTENSVGKPIFVSDNLAFDWMFVCYYFHLFLQENPFGYSGRRIGDLYAGIVGHANTSWKHLRKTKHDHNPVNDAKGNAEALLYMRDHMGLKIDLT